MSHTDHRVLVLLGGPEWQLYRHQGEALAAALRAEGAWAQRVDLPPSTVIKPRAGHEGLAAGIGGGRATDVVTVNVPPGLLWTADRHPPGVRWHTWVQDCYDAFLPLPVYPLETRWHWTARWGTPVLLPATDYGRYRDDVSEGAPGAGDQPPIDVLLAGHLPAPVAGVDDQPVLAKAWDLLTEGAFGYGAEAANCEALLAAAEAVAGWQTNPQARSTIVRWLGRNLARRHEREALAKRLAAICDARRWTLGFAGTGWERLYGGSLGLQLGWVEPGADLAALYRRAKVTVHCNGHVPFHSRPLEAFAAGGFCLTVLNDADPHPELGPLPTCQRDGLEATLSAWSNGPAGMPTRLDCQGWVEQHHTWKQRAEQLLAGTPP